MKKLRAANDIDGIGMCGDAEWIYGEVLHQIEKYLADEFGEVVDGGDIGVGRWCRFQNLKNFRVLKAI